MRLFSPFGSQVQVDLKVLYYVRLFLASLLSVVWYKVRAQSGMEFFSCFSSVYSASSGFVSVFSKKQIWVFTVTQANILIFVVFIIIFLPTLKILCVCVCVKLFYSDLLIVLTKKIILDDSLELSNEILIMAKMLR